MHVRMCTTVYMRKVYKKVYKFFSCHERGSYFYLRRIYPNPLEKTGYRKNNPFISILESLSTTIYPRIKKPFSHIVERRVLFLLQCGRTNENVFPPLNGRKLKKSAFDELHEYYLLRQIRG